MTMIRRNTTIVPRTFARLLFVTGPAVASTLAAAAPSLEGLPQAQTKAGGHGMEWLLGGILIVAGLLVIHGLRLSAEIREVRSRRFGQRGQTT